MFAWSIGSSSWGRTANRRWTASAGVGGSGIRPTGPMSSVPPKTSGKIDGIRVSAPRCRSGPSRCGPSRPASRRLAGTRRGAGRRPAGCPTIAVRAVSVRPHLGRLVDHQLGRPHEPRQPALGIPRPPEPEIGRVLPGEILGVAHEARGPEQAVRPRLVEADPVASSARRSGRRRGCRSRRLPVIRAASRSSVSIAISRVASCGAVSRSSRTRHERSASNTTIVASSASSSSAAWRPRVVELMEDVGVDPARAPLAVDRLGRAGRLDRHVVRVDLRTHAVEQDPALARGRRRRRRCRRPGRRRTSISVSDSTIAPRNCERTCSPRSATARDAARIASLRSRSAPSAGAAGPNSARKHRLQVAGPVDIPFMTARARIRWSWRRVGEQRGRAGDERVGLDPGVDDRPRIRRRVLEPHGRSPRATSRTWGNVDSQSIARCGSSMAATSAMSAGTARRDAGGRRLVAAGRRRRRPSARSRPPPGR